MKHLFSRELTALTAIAALMISCGSSSKLSKEVKEKNNLAQWFQAHEWLNGLQLMPHPSINQQEFYKQNQLNSKWWSEAFNFLKTNDLNNLKPGTYVIDSSNVIATVTELTPKQKEEVNWEAHRDFNDLQYIISGKAQMGVASIDDPKKTIKIPYDSKVDIEVFTVDGGAYYDAGQGTFFIFSPKDIHRPAFRAVGYDTIKKIVIKVRVPPES